MLKSRKIREMGTRVAKLEDDCSKRLTLINLQTAKIEELKREFGMAQEGWERELQSKQAIIDRLNSRLADLGFDVEVLLDDIQWERAKPHLSIECCELNLGPDFSNRFQISNVEQYISRLLPAADLPTSKKA